MQCTFEVQSNFLAPWIFRAPVNKREFVGDSDGNAYKDFLGGCGGAWCDVRRGVQLRRLVERHQQRWQLPGAGQLWQRLLLRLQPPLLLWWQLLLLDAHDVDLQLVDVHHLQLIVRSI